MLRWLVLALLLANAGFWAWSQGWLSPLFGAAPGALREPWRLQQQVRPETVRVLPPGTPLPAPSASAASAAGLGAASAPAAVGSAATGTAVALACLESGPLAPSALDGAEQQLTTVLPARGWVRASRELPPLFAVVIGPLAGREALQKRREELARLRVEFEELRLPGDGASGLALGRYETGTAARAALERLAQRGVRTARVITLREPGNETRLRIESATPAQADALRALKLPGAQVFAPCATPAAGSR